MIDRVWLKSIHIKNICSHKDTYIELCDGVNAIIGESKSGKSSIFRALDWQFNNPTKPTWENLQSWSGGDPYVETVWSNGNIVVKGHDSSGSYYTINGGQPLRGFGVGKVPSEVRKVLNLSEINFQGQFDTSFLICAQPGEVAQFINSMVDLDVIGKAESNANKEKFAIDSKLRSLEARIKGLLEERESFQHIDEIEATLINLEQVERNLEEVKANNSKLLRFKEKITTVTTKADSFGKIIAFENQVSNLLEVAEKITELESKSNKLGGYKNRLSIQGKKADGLRAVLRYEVRVENAINLLGQIREKRAYVAKLNKMQALLRGKENESNSLDKFIKDEENKFHKLMPDTCPLCGATK